MTDAIVQEASQEPSSVDSSNSSSSFQSSLQKEFRDSTLPACQSLNTDQSLKKISKSESPNSSSNSNSSCTSPSPITNNNINQLTTSELYAAVEELRRENERILAELSNTQEVLDLFENYRSLTKEHMNMCICSGKDYLLDKWRKYETEYRKLMPIKRVIQTNLSPKTTDELVSVGSNEKVHNNQRVINGFQMPKYKIGPGFSLETNQVVAKSWVPTNDVICSAISSNAPKSKIRSYLDTIVPIYDPNLIPTLPLLTENLRYNYKSSPKSQSLSHSSSSQSLTQGEQTRLHAQSNQILIHKGNQIIVRKRMLAPDLSDEEESLPGQLTTQGNDSNYIFKKGNSLVSGRKFTFLTNNNKFNIGGDKTVLTPKINNSNSKQHKNVQQETPDQEEERLDQLNNALDQILLGRYDALNQLQPRSQTRTNTLGVSVNVTRPLREEDGEMEMDSGDESDEEEEHQQSVQQQVTGEEEDDEDIIFLDEVKSSNQANAPTATAIVVPLKPKIQVMSSDTASSILGAALESGFKPYPTYHQISTGKSVNTGSISTPITAVVSTNSSQ